MYKILLGKSAILFHILYWEMHQTVALRGGEPVAAPNDTPWMVRYEDRRNGHKVDCGGVLITPSVFLAAAHCLYANADIADVSGDKRPTAYLGSRNRSVPYFSNAVSESLERHSEFDDGIKELNGSIDEPKVTSMCPSHDIVAFLLASSVAIDENVRPIEIAADLPFNDDGIFQADCMTVGWGEENESNQVLKFAKFDRIFSNGACQRLLIEPVNQVQQSRYNETDAISVVCHDKPLDGSNICTNETDGGACRGESGSPLVCRLSSDGPWRLYGLAAAGLPRCPHGLDGDLRVGVYTSVVALRDWISQTVAKVLPVEAAQLAVTGGKECVIKLMPNGPPLCSGLSTSDRVVGAATSMIVQMVLLTFLYLL